MDRTDCEAYSTEEAKWAALVQRDPQAEGAFLYGVATTSVYCRPGCASRRPNRDNVRFFDTVGEAERAGFRPCKRCAPRQHTADEDRREAILRACRLMEEADEPPALADLARSAGLSPSRFQREFKRMVGITPKQYAMEKRTQRVRHALEGGSTVTDAMLQAGYSSSSRFYEGASSALGMKPSAYQRRGRGAHILYGFGRCSLGWALVATTDRGICAIHLGDERDALVEALRSRFSEAEVVESDKDLDDIMEQVLAFIDAPQQTWDLPLDIRGTAFQRRVWQALREIAPGSTSSYSEVAARIGQPKASRAVGSACAANPIAVVIPCHRVLRRDGGLGGYRWGLERKRLLLETEGQRKVGHPD